MGDSLSYLGIIGTLVSVIVLGLPLYFARRYHQKADYYENKRSEVQNIYETYKNQEIWKILSEYTGLIHKKIIDYKLSEIRQVRGDEISIEKVVGIMFSGLDPKTLIYRGYDDKPLNAEIERQESLLKKAFKDFFDIDAHRVQCSQIASNIGNRLFLITIAIGGIIGLIILYLSSYLDIPYIVGISTFLSLITIRELIYMYNDRNEFERAKREYDDGYDKYPPSEKV